MTIQAIGLGIRDDLRSNLTDPIQRKQQGMGEWIHYDRISEVGKTPAIFIQSAPSPRHDNYVGGDQDNYFNFIIQTVTSDGDRGISPSGDSNTIITKDDELRDAITDAIVERLKSARIAISGCNTITLVNYDGEFDLSPTKIVTTLRYEAYKK